MRHITVFLRRVDGLLPWISKACIFVSSIILVFLLVIFGWLVFGRYVLNVTPTWVEQVALLVVCYITFLGSAAGIHEESHLGVQFIRESFPRFIHRPLRILTDIILSLFGLAMLIYCIQLVQFGWSTKLAMLDLPEGVRTLSAAICGGLVFIFAGAHALSKTYRYYFSDEVIEEERA